MKDNIESPEESADNPSLQTSDESSSIPTLEAKAEGAPMFHAATFGQKSVTKYVDNKLGAVLFEEDDIKHSDNFPSGKENSVDECLYGEELNSNDVHEVSMWTIPDFIIALCGDNQLPIQERPQTEFDTVDSDVKVAGEKESAVVESWNDGCLIPSCEHTCSNLQNIDNVSIPRAEANSTQVSSLHLGVRGLALGMETLKVFCRWSRCLLTVLHQRRAWRKLLGIPLMQK